MNSHQASSSPDITLPTKTDMVVVSLKCPSYIDSSDVDHPKTKTLTSQVQKITLGPIIGSVTDSTARILVEFERSGTETISLVSPEGTKSQCTKQVPARRPTVFSFTGLSAKTIYNVLSDHSFPVESSSFRTLTGKSSPLQLAFCSNNNRRVSAEYNEETCLWNDLATRAVQKQIDYIIHLGGQVDIDSSNVYKEARRLLDQYEEKDWRKAVGKIRELLREEYRKTFGSKAQATAMANCPNLMQFSDLEMKAGVGARPSRLPPDTIEGFYLQQARYVYYEYQRQLREDIDFKNLNKFQHEFHKHVVNGVGVFFVDHLGKDSWLNAPEKGQFGKYQWGVLKGALSTGAGGFDGCDAVIIASSQPIVIHDKGFMKLTNKKSVKFAGEDTNPRYIKEQAALLSLLEDWKDASNTTQREVYLVCGGFDKVGYTDINHCGHKALTQIVTAGICQKLPKLNPLSPTYQPDRETVLQQSWSFVHRDWSAKNSYVLLSMKKGKASVTTVEMITSAPSEKIEAKSVVLTNSRPCKSEKACCTIF